MMEVIPEKERVRSVGVVFRETRMLPRCAVRTKKGAQCKGAVGASGEGGAWLRHPDDPATRVPVCTTHKWKMMKQGWELG